MKIKLSLKFISILGLSLALLTGCGEKVAQSRSQIDQKIEGWIFDNSPTNYFFITFTNKDGSITGNLYEHYEVNNQLHNFKSAITGTISGQNITINVTANGATVSGTIKGRALDLAFAMNDGTILNREFHPGTINDFNKDFAKIKTKVKSDQGSN